MRATTARPLVGGMALRIGQHVALVAGEAEGLARGPVDLGIALRIERLLRVLAQIGDDRAGLVLDVGAFTPAIISVISVPMLPRPSMRTHHAVDDRRPLRRVVHRGIGQVVALHAVAQREPRARASRGSGSSRGVEGRRQDALEHRPVRALPQRFLASADFVRAR